MISSWSGGKDACLALARAAETGYEPGMLMTMLTEDGGRSRSNGVPTSVLQAQALSIGVEFLGIPTSWSAYQATFRRALIRAMGHGFAAVVFGDIAGEAHRTWLENTTRAIGAPMLLPLWQESSVNVLRELRAAGYRAWITSARADVLEPTVVGREIDADLVEELSDAGIDPCGENGEFHTVVADGPLFLRPLDLRFGPVALRSGFWHAEVALRRRMPGRS